MSPSVWSQVLITLLEVFKPCSNNWNQVDRSSNKSPMPRFLCTSFGVMEALDFTWILGRE